MGLPGKDDGFMEDNDYKWCRNCKSFSFGRAGSKSCLRHNLFIDDPNCNSCQEFELYTFSYYPDEKEDNSSKELKNPFDYQEGGSHYKVEGTMDIAEWSKRRGHCPYQWNVMKYVDRHKKKNGIEDLRKAKQYLEFIAYIEYGENL